VGRNLDLEETSRGDFRDRAYNSGPRLADSRPVVGADHHECEPAPGEIPLVTNALVRCDDCIEAGVLRHPEELPVGQLGPAAFLGCFDLMSEQPVSQRSRSVVVQQYSHLPASSRYRIPQAAGGVLLYEHHQLPRHTGKPLQELVNRGATFQIGRECRNRHASPPKHPGAANPIGAPLDCRAGGPINHGSLHLHCPRHGGGPPPARGGAGLIRVASRAEDGPNHKVARAGSDCTPSAATPCSAGAAARNGRPARRCRSWRSPRSGPRAASASHR
jgi:hypothetical protein